MALNKYMHPRNIYKNPPDFVNLATLYEEFSNIVKKEVTGKVTIDFKDPQSLRVLTKCLLKSDFNLDVNIPEDRLVPTLPLRLNYILWIEDLLMVINKTDNTWGLDIGTGACAIYPLLAAIKNKWHMVGTETDEQSLLAAQGNVRSNNLQEFINLVKNPTASLLEHLFTNGNTDVEQFAFSMCNPPFYCSIEDLCDSRSPGRLPPKNGFTGSPQELITEGGELTFCRKMIEESKCYKDKVLIFTTMVGHKYNLRELLQDMKAEGINHTSTEFCQGRVTRWGLAWTFQDYNISQLIPARDKQRKKNTPIVYQLPELPDMPYDIDSVSTRIKSVFQELRIEYKFINKRGNNVSLDIKAMTNTWSNQRRKRRLVKRQEIETCKNPKLNNLRYDKCIIPANNFISETAVTTEIKDTQTFRDKQGKQLLNKNAEKLQTNQHSRNPSHANDVYGSDEIRDNDNDSNVHIDLNIVCPESITSIKAEPVVHAIFKIIKKQSKIHLEMEFLNGSAGKEGVHQIIQYIKNKWK